MLQKKYEAASIRAAEATAEKRELAAAILAIVSQLPATALNRSGKQEFLLIGDYKVGRTRKAVDPTIDEELLKRKLNPTARRLIFPKIEVFSIEGLQEAIAKKIVTTKTIEECTTYHEDSYSVLVRKVSKKGDDEAAED